MTRVTVRSSTISLAVAAALAAFPACSSPSKSSTSAPTSARTFDSAAAAGDALFEATQRNDEAAMDAVLGPDATNLVSSGDAAADQNARDNFVAKYRQMHRIGLDSQRRTVLYIGAENWPFPIPLVENDKQWEFDTAAGKQEILFRRVGRNEASAIQICEELAAAQEEYFGKSHDGAPPREYAQHFVSSPGKHDGLFWTSTGDESDSPIGELLAFATSEATAKEAHNGPTPFHGYFFRLLKAQGAAAPGGAHSFIVDGKMTRGFAFLAYPAEYQSSGVMSFLIGPDRIVRQRNLGPDPEVAKGITEFDPDEGWEHID